VQALEAYRGALLVVSHDVAFVGQLGITRSWTLGEAVADAQLT
jgi:ATPase subunit of ABC transporter with duplicated ATPase domains